jgi:hypothetical protein
VALDSSGFFESGRSWPCCPWFCSLFSDMAETISGPPASRQS